MEGGDCPAEVQGCVIALCRSFSCIRARLPDRAVTQTQVRFLFDIGAGRFRQDGV